MLYIFAGFPGKGLGAGTRFLNAGGLSHCIQVVEELGALEVDKLIQYRKDGVFMAGTNDFLYPVEYRISERLLAEGITWGWFHHFDWHFGNGVTIHGTYASPEYKSVVQGTDLSMDEFLAMSEGPVPFSELMMERKQVGVKSWQKYEARWTPGTCPDQNHVVHLTWGVTKEPLAETAYTRLQAIVEEQARPDSLDDYNDHHFSTIRKFDGKRNHYAEAPR